ncbi:MAG TPA: hypothetical protein VFV55_06465 [Usitatibacteraceae bacterium]|nr:hypothetical protein [Usitatibacteraceae bacterium]
MNRNKSQERPRPGQAVHSTAAELEGLRVVERPDGFWVQPASGGREIGPYASVAEAIEDQRATDEDELEPGGALAEVEAQLGVSDWIDPDTAAPAEDSVPHIEEH